MRVAINGFGRIGRTVFKTIISSQDWGRIRLDPRINRENMKVVALNNLGGVNDTLAYLCKYDSVYGTYPEDVGVGTDGQSLVVGDEEYLFLDESDPSQLPWKDLDVDVVLECTGAFTRFDKARAHLEAGAKRVVISANAKGEGPTVVLGTDSMQILQAAEDKPSLLEVVSCGSCTTNAAAPAVQILHDHFRVLKAQMTTVHAVTSTQSIVDGINKNLRRSRTAYASVIPQPTGAAKAVGKVIPELSGLVSGVALRVPVICGSVVEIVAHVGEETTVERVNETMRGAAQGDKQGIVVVSEEEMVSTDIVGLPVSTVVDAPLTEVLGNEGSGKGDLVKIVVWYDNEYGYTCRLAGLAQELGNHTP